MKKKTILTIVILAAAVLALLFAGLPLFSRLYYGRSQAATLFAWQLHKERYTTEEAFQEYLAEKRAENAEPYLLPLDEAPETDAVPIVRGGMAGYALHPNGARLILYFAGGSYIDQPRAVHWQFLSQLAEDTDAAVVVPIYPKLPDRDAAAAYEALTDFCRELLADGSWDELIFMGDSAGGGMALSLAMQLRDAGAEGPDKLILICPWLDVTLSNPDIPAYEKKDPALDSEQLRHLGALWAGDLSPTDPVVSPLYGHFEDLGAITLITGTGELLYPDIMALDDLLTREGIPHDTYTARGMFHVWPLYVAYDIPETQAAYSQIVHTVTG